MNKNSMTYTIIFIFLVSFAFVFLLSLTNIATVDQIEANEELARRRAILSAIGIEYSGEEDINSTYEQDIVGDVDAGLFVYEGPEGTVYAKRFIGAGLWGSIEGFLAVSGDFDQLVGLEIVDHNETPGLGGRITEPWFKEQFEGERIPEDGFEVTGGGDGDDDKTNGAVDGVTGATRTSESIETIVRTQLDALQSDSVQEQLRALQSQGGTT